MLGYTGEPSPSHPGDISQCTVIVFCTTSSVVIYSAFNTNRMNKLGLSCAKLRFHCARRTFEIVEALNQLNL